MNTTTTARPNKVATSRWFDSRRVRRRISVTVLTAALLSSTACGSAAPPMSTTTAGIPTTSTPPTTTTDARPVATLDELVSVGGTRMHVRCTGSGPTTVLLIAGFEAGSDSWAKVEPAISAQTRVCSHDRPGTGTSDPAVATANFATQATDLHDLLAMIGEPGPYVVVGHSFGGAEAVTFASKFTDEVTGLVLVDASPVTWPQALCAVADDGSNAANMVRGLCAGWSDPTGNAERLDVFSAFAGAVAITSLGTLPMAIITAVDRQVPDGLAPEELARLTDAWDRGQQQWSQLSTAARVLSLEDTGHNIQLDHPNVVTDEIARLLP